MTQDEFREAMNRTKREDRLLMVADNEDVYAALGYDSGTNEATVHGGKRLPLGTLREVNLP